MMKGTTPMGLACLLMLSSVATLFLTAELLKFRFKNKNRMLFLLLLLLLAVVMPGAKIFGLFKM